MAISRRTRVPQTVVLLSTLLVYCNPVRQYGEMPSAAAGDTSADAGSAGERSSEEAAGAAGHFAEGGQAGESEPAGGEANWGGEGGAAGAAGAAGADAEQSSGGTSAGSSSGGAGGAKPAGECGPSLPCSAAAGRPFCNAASQCVRCLQDTDCPTASGQCLARKCDLGECQEVPKPNTTACDDGVYCNGSDKCDAAGHCTTHANDVCSGKLCHEETRTCTCNTVPSIPGAGYCGTGDEATDRAAVQTATNACMNAGCCVGCNPNYTRAFVAGCTEFHCLP